MGPRSRSPWVPGLPRLRRSTETALSQVGDQRIVQILPWGRSALRQSTETSLRQSTETALGQVRVSKHALFPSAAYLYMGARISAARWFLRAAPLSAQRQRSRKDGTGKKY